MLIYAFDPGCTTTGYSIFDTATMRDTPDLWASAATGLLDCGTIQGSSSKYLRVRMKQLQRAVAAVKKVGIEKHVESSGEAIDRSVALIETPAWAGTYHKKRSPASVAGLNRWIGALAATCVRAGFESVEYTDAAKVEKERRYLAVTAAIRSAGQVEPDQGTPHDVYDSLYLAIDWIVNEHWKEAA